MAKNAYVTVDENASSPLPRDRRGDMISGVTHYEPITNLTPRLPYIILEK